jgi:glucose/arabinose dehydrogenase
MRAVALAAGLAAALHVPHGYRTHVFARGLTHPTALAWGPDARLYVTEDVGRVVSVGRGSHAPRTVATGIPTPLGLVWVRRRLFVSAQGRIVQVRPRSRTLVRGLPYGLHQQDNIVYRRGRLYFGSGSTCDACRERDPRSAAILSVRLDGSGLRVVANGLRNPFGLVVAPRSRRLYASVNNRDRLGAAEPAEAIVRVRSGAFYGWPDCWPSWRLRRLVGACRGVAPPVAYLEPHSSANGMAFWHGHLFIAEWGQYNGTTAGRRIVELVPRGRTWPHRVFAYGIPHPLALVRDRRGDALLVADWQQGVIYRISRAR